MWNRISTGWDKSQIFTTKVFSLRDFSWKVSKPGGTEFGFCLTSMVKLLVTIQQFDHGNSKTADCLQRASFSWLMMLNQNQTYPILAGLC